MLDSLEGRHIADWVSTATLGAAVTVDVMDALRADEKGRAFADLACRQVTAQAIVQVVKLAVPRWRPDHSDQKSFFSGHTATTAASGDWFRPPTGWSLGVSVAFTTVTGAGRMLAGRHHPSDVVVGAIDGAFTSWLCGKIVHQPDR